MNPLMKRPGHSVWDPFEMIDDLQEEVNRLFSRRIHKKNGWEKITEPDVDVIDEKEALIVKADLPGIKKEDLEIKVEGRTLTIKGERKEENEIKEKNFFASERYSGAFTRLIELPTEVKTEQVKAAYKDGVLEITLPKTEGAKAKQISVEVK